MFRAFCLFSIAAVTLLLPSLALAEDAIDIDRIAGVYKRAFMDELVDGTKYPAEDILEIVKISPSAAYIRLKLNFYNGHECNLWAVGELEDGALTYHDPTPEFDGHLCVLKLTIKKSKIYLEDVNLTCRRMYCGARGGLDGDLFDLSKRRNIRYMDRLKSSREFHDALKAYHERPQ